MSNIVPVLIMMMAAAARKRALEPLLSKAATAPERAIRHEPDRRDRRTFDELRRIGAVAETEPGRYWYDAASHRAADRRSTRQAVIAGLAVAGAATLTAFALTR